MRICRPRSADVIHKFKRNVLQFTVQQSFSCSYQTGFFFRGCEKPEPCQLLSERPQSGAENKSKRSRPAEHRDAAGGDVTSRFPVWACASVEPRLNMKSSQQKNNQTKQYKKTKLLFSFSWWVSRDTAHLLNTTTPNRQTSGHKTRAKN